MTSIITKRYLKAILQVWEKSELKDLLQKLDSLKQIYMHQNFMELLKSPYLTADKKQEFVLGFLKDEDSRLRGLIRLLLHNGRIAILPDLYTSLQEVVNEDSKTYKGVVYVPEFLDETMLKKIRENLIKRLGVELELTQEKTQKQGIFLAIDGLGVEVSFSNERFLKDLKSHIIKAI